MKKGNSPQIENKTKKTPHYSLYGWIVNTKGAFAKVRQTFPCLTGLIKTYKCEKFLQFYSLSETDLNLSTHDKSVQTSR